MPDITRSAPGKVILCGEHSVVYGYPAIAVPVSGLRARATISAAPSGSGLRIVAADLNETVQVKTALPTHPLAAIARGVLAHLALPEPDATLTLRSEVPIAAGLGSGTTVSVAVARALAAHLGQELDTETVSALAYEVEKIHHGTPSGIDNTVVAYERPVYFVKGQPPTPFTIHTPFHLLIANSGIPSATRHTVAAVRQRWEANRATYEAYFKRMGDIADAAREHIEAGQIKHLAPLLDENHALLRDIGVSLPVLDQLVSAAREAGAWGAKLTGGGGGGNVIALVPPAHIETVTAALRQAGATQVWHTEVESH